MKNILIPLIILISIFGFVIYMSLSNEKTTNHQETISIENSKTPKELGLLEIRDITNMQTGVPVDMKLYEDTDNLIKFNYSKDLIIEKIIYEEDNDRYSYLNHKDDKLNLNIVNPDYKKRIYDCCYTSEEVEKYGEKESIRISIRKLDDLKREHTYDELGQTIIDTLISEGVSPNNALKTLSYVPTSIDQNLAKKKIYISKLKCSLNEIVNINGNLAIYSNGCMNDTPQRLENTQITFMLEDEYITIINDVNSRYSQEGYFDEIVKSLRFE